MLAVVFTMATEVAVPVVLNTGSGVADAVASMVGSAVMVVLGVWAGVAVEVPVAVLLIPDVVSGDRVEVIVGVRV